MKIKTFLLYIFAALLSLPAFAEPLAWHGSKLSITLQKKHSPVVDKAVEILTEDLGRSGLRVRLSGSGNIMVYQLDEASNKDMRALGSQLVPIMGIITKRDAYWLGVRKGKLIIVGSNGRGTAYGLMHFSQMAGDIGDGYETTQVPSVEFRGISIEGISMRGNDCRRLFPMLLRLRANVLCAGWDDSRLALHVNKNLRAVADSFGIDIATPQDGKTVRLHGHKKDALNINISWADDGYGYMRRTDSDERGGAVYHLSYAGHPHDYQWLATTQPGLVSTEMLTAFRHGADRLWMVALHDPNVAAYPLSLFMDLAWDVDTLGESGVQGHLSSWLKKNFGEAAAKDLEKPLQGYYRLVGICRPEFTDRSYFNAGEFGNELERYLNDYRAVFKSLKTIGDDMETGASDKFFMTVGYPVFGSALLADKELEAQESRLIGRKPSFHHDDEALESAARSMKAHWALLSLTRQFDGIVSKQSWNKTLDTGAKGLPVFREPVFTDTVSVDEVEKYYSSEPVYAPLSNDGCIVRNACDYSSASEGVQTRHMLGHSMKAVEMGKGTRLTYRFRSNAFGGVLRLAFIPTFSPDGSSSQCSVGIDESSPTTIIVNDGSASSDRWAQGVLRGQSLVTLPVSLSSGMHTLTIMSLSGHVIFDQWMTDRDTDREFYVFPVGPAW